MKRNWYKFRVKYSKEMDDGKKKKVSEEYLVDAESFTETEKRANKAATDLIGTRDFDITAISREPVSDIIKGTEQDDNHWYKDGAEEVLAPGHVRQCRGHQGGR